MTFILMFYMVQYCIFPHYTQHQIEPEHSQCNHTHYFHMLLLRRYQIYSEVTKFTGLLGSQGESLTGRDPFSWCKLGYFVTFSLQTGQYATLFYWDWHFVSERDQMYSSSSYFQVGLLLLCVLFFFFWSFFERCHLK